MEPQPNFEFLFARYYKRLFYTALNITKNAHTAEDVVQETYLKAFLKSDSIHNEEKLGAWLSAIATRTAIDFIRKEARGLAVSLEAIVQQNELFALESDHNVEQEVALSLFKEDIEQEIKALKPEHQAIFLLKVNSGLKEEEIAKQLDLKPATVKTRLYRTRKHLKAVLSERYTA
ncbi:RNA polymerase sigma factor [Bacillus sp. V3-13]|uniref:RNA polymerase sigma factor n=1 Tax=Bacillus sp. V3-13 TaxID=2053728 RepID=UPI000C761700|nr:RNA polymerase sigma factor [Bacillus sp. V3-13]PLR76639.1 RNA polymerase sigma factor [Bacillus sp. V3-13]